MHLDERWVLGCQPRSFTDQGAFSVRKSWFKIGFNVIDNSVRDPQVCRGWAHYKWKGQRSAVLRVLPRAPGWPSLGVWGRWLPRSRASGSSVNRSFCKWGINHQSDWQLEPLLKAWLLGGKGFKRTLTPTWAVHTATRYISPSWQPGVSFRVSLIEYCLWLLESLPVRYPD